MQTGGGGVGVGVGVVILLRGGGDTLQLFCVIKLVCELFALRGGGEQETKNIAHTLTYAEAILFAKVSHLVKLSLPDILYLLVNL